jgi:hypothetical protein
MNRMRLLIFCLFVFATPVFSQSEETQLDTTVFRLETKEPPLSQRLQITIGYGSFLKLSGNTFDVYGKLYNQGIDGEKFAGEPEQINSKKNFLFGIDFSLTKRIMIGCAVLPSQLRSFRGGNGTNYYSAPALWGLISGSANYLQGVYVHEQIRSNNYTLRGSYIAVPFKESQKEGIQIIAGAGIFLNTTQVATNLCAFDYIFNGSVTTVYNHGQNFVDRKKGIGAYFNLRMDVRFASLFSIFGEITKGFGPKYTISQKSFVFMSQTALAPEHVEKFSGFGATVGVALRFIEFKNKKRSK